MIQATNEGTILECVKAVGPSPGAKKMLTWEFKHAQESIMNGIYVTWVSPAAKDDCFRVGSESRCFCGHLFSKHNLQLKKKTISNCNECACKAFQFIPRRPEEVGQWWMPRRKGFNVHQWRPSCQCKHTHEEHQPNRPNKCKSCSCFQFTSDFCCLNCDQKFEEHETLYELEKERKMARKPIGEEYLPLSRNPEIQAETMKKLGLDGRSAEERLMEELKLEKESNQPITLQIQGDGEGGVSQRPQVQLVINSRQQLAPKQNLAKPEKSIQVMQQRGMAGLGPKKPTSTAAKGGGFVSKAPNAKK